MDTRDKSIDLRILTAPQPEADDAEYRAYVEKRVKQGQADVKRGRTLTEDEVWKDLGVED